MTTPPGPGSIATLAVLQAVHDYQEAYDASTGQARIDLPTAWLQLCTAYPETAVEAAYAREASNGHLTHGHCPATCELCVRQGPPTRLTDKGLACLAELRSAA
ncbi:hypothetical protein ACIOEZ_34545 [Streptomyces sp. NPDC087866]|uniref:hypothetical protein n=1 Tax=Streptomyces sp. NPDC087866 TaxID=3365815 RepID=UPI003816C234